LTEALVLAVILAPTDAALGQAVVTEPRLPSRIRQGLNVESGLNDGICVPLLLIVLAGADVEANVETGHHALTVLAEELGYGLVGGALAGVVAAAIVATAGRRALISRAWLPIIPVGAVALAYGIAIVPRRIRVHRGVRGRGASLHCSAEIRGPIARSMRNSASC
jgi:NhaP-type Na+/H+ or K+/H+ antiporter